MKRMARIKDSRVTEIIMVEASMVGSLYRSDEAVVWAEASAEADFGWDFTPPDIFSPHDGTEAALQYEESQLQAFLAKTDKALARQIETGEPAYPSTLAARASARSRITEIRVILNPPPILPTQPESAGDTN